MEQIKTRSILRQLRNNRVRETSVRECTWIPHFTSEWNRGKICLTTDPANEPTFSIPGKMTKMRLRLTPNPIASLNREHSNFYQNFPFSRAKKTLQKRVSIQVYNVSKIPRRRKRERENIKKNEGAK